MQELCLHEFHRDLGANFAKVAHCEVVSDYGDPVQENEALIKTAAFLDLSFRSRLCLTGQDRIRFLHGQVTNDIKRLRPGSGCYAAVVNAKGRMESDLNAYCLEDELLLDFEPGLAAPLVQRLEKYIVADDVQVIDVSSSYGLLSIQGPDAARVLSGLGIVGEIPAEPFRISKAPDSVPGEVYVANQPRLGTAGFDLFAPAAPMTPLAEKIIALVKASGGRAAGWSAFELARIERGIPRFGADMDESTFPQECGLEERALSYSKGCYIGQEVLNRIHTVGHVNRALRGLRLSRHAPQLPAPRDKLFRHGREVGYLTSITNSPRLGTPIALGYVRTDADQPGVELIVRSADGEFTATVTALPFATE